MKYFAHILSDPNRAKALYRKLAMQHHPDRGGDTATMQDINDQYFQCLKSMHKKEYTYEARGETKTTRYYFNEDLEKEIMERIGSVLELKLTHIDVLLIGTWIWVTGTKKEDKDLFNKNGVGFKWHSKRDAWYWHPPTKRRTRYNKNATLSGLAYSYGSEEYKYRQGEERNRLS